ncbi:hypothetical protein [Hymenobacter chitinivorans]|uniref:Uncharacterized protein n=1 Tax=Hymenobacter chitinivorans DSM 11115 TaxID=1121954 RepID=A0A2M9BQ65_9BACT|nr:hypothetical protein [Hymenobacter chitinivorans]PJJ60042.1 hypothetical protein CLV45_1467 [Hymenobacter chitinivorans DSM 11115]
MRVFKQLLAAGLLLSLPATIGCSLLNSGSGGSGASSTSGSSTSGSSMEIEGLRSEIREQERVTEEAKLRAKSEQERLEAKRHQLKAAEREQKANQVRSGS